MSNVGAHWPTNKLPRVLPIICMVAETAMDPTATHRNASDGSFRRLRFDRLGDLSFRMRRVFTSIVNGHGVFPSSPLKYRP
jgi:hypothetical protein